MEFKEPPKRVFLQYHGDATPSDEPVNSDDVTWCWNKIWDADITYVRESSASSGGYAPTAAIVAQVAWWSRALRQMNKAIKRKNKYINRLENENAELRSELADIHDLYIEALNRECA